MALQPLVVDASEGEVIDSCRGAFNAIVVGIRAFRQWISYPIRPATHVARVEQEFGSCGVAAGKEDGDNGSWAAVPNV